MTNSLIQNLTGAVCTIATGPMGETFEKVRVEAVEGTWLRVRRKEKLRLVNADYITSVRIIEPAEAQR